MIEVRSGFTIEIQLEQSESKLGETVDYKISTQHNYIHFILKNKDKILFVHLYITNIR